MKTKPKTPKVSEKRFCKRTGKKGVELMVQMNFNDFKVTFDEYVVLVIATERPNTNNC